MLQVPCGPAEALGRSWPADRRSWAYSILKTCVTFFFFLNKNARESPNTWLPCMECYVIWWHWAHTLTCQ